MLRDGKDIMLTAGAATAPPCLPDPQCPERIWLPHAWMLRCILPPRARGWEGGRGEG
jgi:hypothetical protein